MRARQDEHTGLQAIEVATTTTINHWELGRQFFEWDNVQQALFLHGAHVGHAELGAWGHLQISYIRDAAEANGTLPEIRELIASINNYFEAA
jgi:hypothetical protein